jgi:hypothetical protein
MKISMAGTKVLGGKFSHHRAAARFSVAWTIALFSPIIFDQRPEQSTSLTLAFQFSLYGISLLACVLMDLKRGIKLPTRWRLFIVPYLLFMIVGTLGTSSNDGAWFESVTVAILYACPILGFLVAVVQVQNFSVVSIEQTLFQTTILSIIFLVFIRVVLGDVPLVGGRYLIVSPAFTMLVAQCMARVIVRARLTDVLILALGLAFAIATFTRTYVMLFPLAFAFSQLLMPTKLSTKLVTFIVLVAGCFTLFLFMNYLWPELIDGLARRFETSLTTADPALVARDAETRWLWSEFTKDTTVILIGHGFGSHIQHDLWYLYSFPELYVKSEVDTISSELTGHQGYLTLLFLTGTVGTMLAIVSLLIPLRTGFSAFKKVTQSSERTLLMSAWIYLALILAEGFYDGLMAHRIMGYLLGISIGYLFSLPLPRASGYLSARG